MVDPATEGIKLYKLLYNDYDDNFGGSVVGISGMQGSVKTSAMLDLADKKTKYHPDEKIFWRETYKSPMQCQRLKTPYIIYAQDGVKLNFFESQTWKKVNLDINYFNTISELYNKVRTGIVNVVFFEHEQRWTNLIEECNRHYEWATVFLDEMEDLYREGVNNQTEDRWWDFMQTSGDVIKECRKSHTSVIGNYHDENLIDHRVRNKKFMFFLYGYGATVSPKKTRIKQGLVDGCKRGEFAIGFGRSRFGKIQIETIYDPIKNCIIVEKK